MMPVCAGRAWTLPGRLPVSGMGAASPVSPACTAPAACPASLAGQRGQALVEALVAMLAMAVLWVGLNWLGHYQDMALSTAHASRHAAFLATRIESSHLQSDEPGSDRVKRYFTGEAHRWSDRRAARLLNPDAALHASWRRDRQVSTEAQPGTTAPYAATLRKDWSLEDQGIVQASVRLDFDDRPRPVNNHDGLLGLAVFDKAYPTLRRSTYILAGAGHAVSDSAVQEQVAASRLAWAAAHEMSSGAGSAVAGRAAVVDAGWGRGEPQFDWLQPWSGYVPAHLIENHEGKQNEHTLSLQ